MHNLKLVAVSTLFALSANAADKIPSRIDMRKIQDIAVEVSDEIDNGFVCETYARFGTGFYLQSETEGHCPTGDLRAIYGRRWVKDHYLKEKQVLSKIATPVISLMDGSELRLESIEFYSKDWNYKSPLNDWLKKAKSFMPDAQNVYNVYSTIPCYRNALSTEIIRDRRAGGIHYTAATVPMYVDCSSQDPDSIIVIKDK